MNNTKAVRLTESAIMIALGTVLSIFKLVDLPYGGSVTFAHMLPVILIAYRYGTGWGVLTGATYGLLQMLLGIKNLMGTSFAAVVVILLFDYIIAYTVTCLGGVFRQSKLSQSSAIAFGALLACAARYICHVISGCTVWAEYNYTELPTVVYSLIYNATYMIPETIVTVVAAAYIGSVLDFRGTAVVRLQPEKRTDAQILLTGFAKLCLAAAAIFDVQAIFSRLQSEDTGLFSAANMATAPWLSMATITVAAAAVAFVCYRAASRQDLSVLSRGLWIGAVIGAAAAYGQFVSATLAKAADKAGLPAPYSLFGNRLSQTFDILGVKYGVPLLVAGVCLLGFAILTVRHVMKGVRTKKTA